MLDEEHGQAEIPVETAERGDELGGGDRVELSRRLVEDQNLRLHDDHAREVEQLLLPAGERRRRLREPVLDPEIGRRLRHTRRDLALRHAEVLEPEYELMPDLVRDDLLLGLLHDESDRRRGAQGIEVVLLLAEERDFAGSLPERRDLPLQKPEHGRFAASRRAADRRELPGLDGEVHIPERRRRRARVGEAQIFDRYQRHRTASLISMIAGRSARSP